MEEAEKKYPNHKPLFSIAINNFDPNKKVTTEDIAQRIKWINTL
jgi:hypothetical protein